MELATDKLSASRHDATTEVTLVNHLDINFIFLTAKGGRNSHWDFTITNLFSILISGVHPTTDVGEQPIKFRNVTSK